MREIKRVVIAEPSLKTEQGHYRVYAETLAEAWRSRGVQVLLLGHRTAEPGRPGLPVRPAFTADFWQALETPRGWRFYALVGLRRVLRPVAVWLWFSDRQFGAGRPGAPPRDLRLAKQMRRPVEWATRLSERIPETQARTFEARRAAGLRRSIARLARELKGELARLSPPLSPEDLVFLPTAREVEAAAVAELLSRWKPARRAAFGLVFRQPAAFRHPGSRWSDILGSLRGGVYQRSLAALGRAPGVVARFTDSAQLTDQHAALDGGTYTTLPIPHTEIRTPADESADAGPLTLAYLGDARTEKGFSLLPELVQAVRDAHPARPVRFRIQCNFNVAGGEPDVARALGRLRAMAGPDLELLEQPLSRADYTAALRTSDVILAAYDPDLYRERSSGIACEALALGIPLVAPAGTWLESEFAAGSDRMMRAGWEALPGTSASSAELYRLRKAGLARSFQLTLFDTGELAFAPARWSWVEFSLPSAGRRNERVLMVELGVASAPPASIFKVTADIHGRGETALSKRVYTVHVGEGGAYAGTERRTHPLFGVRIPAGASRVRLVFRNDYSDEVIKLDDLRLRLVTPPPGSPLGAVGRAFVDAVELPGAVLEVIENIDHYRRTAREHAVAYGARHNAEALTRAVEAALTGR